MKLDDLDTVQQLKGELTAARSNLANARAITAATVEPRCSVAPLEYRDGTYSFARGASVSFELPPIPTSQVVSACERAVSKIVARLQQLGVEVPPETNQESPHGQAQDLDA